MCQEHWKMVTCNHITPNTLAVSTYGNFQIHDPDEHALYHLDEYVSSNGFKYVITKTTNMSYEKQMFPSDDIVAKTFIPIPKHLEGKPIRVHHKDNDPTNNHITNLEWIFDQEEFRAITFNDIKRETYEVSQFGIVRLKSTHEIISPFITPEGYYLISLMCTDHDRKRRYRMNRIVAHEFIQHLNPEQNCVNHIDGIRNNNYWKNLEWVTNTENIRHASLTHSLSGSETRDDAPMSTEEAIMVCESLNRNHSDCGLVYDELKDKIPTLTRRRVLLIKNGKSFKRTGNIVLREEGKIKRTYNEKHYNESDIIEIANVLKQNNGDCFKTLKQMKQKYYWINADMIYRIKHKDSFVDITDKIFKRGDFPQYGITEDQVIMICEALLRHKNDEYPTLEAFKEVREYIPGLNKDVVRNIKSKKTFHQISDKYFPKGYFTK